MIYRITPAPTRGDLSVRFAPNATLSEIERGSELAGSLRARSLKDCAAYIMPPKTMTRWQLLFDAGFEPFVTSLSVTRFRRWPGESMRMAKAVEIARTQVEAGKQLEAVE